MSGLERVLDFDNSDGSGDDEYTTFANGSQIFELQPHQDPTQASRGSYAAGLSSFSTPPYSDKAFSQHDLTYEEFPIAAHQVPDYSYRDHISVDLPRRAPLPPTLASWHSDPCSTSELSDVLGQLKINENGVGMFR